MVDTWYVVNALGSDLATGRPPAGAGAPSPATALASVPVVSWPLGLVAGDGHRAGLAWALGPGGDAVEDLLRRLVLQPPRPEPVELARLAQLAPAGKIDLPVDAVVPLGAGADASVHVDPTWLASVEATRVQARTALVDAGRATELDAALNVAMLLVADLADLAHVGDADVGDTAAAAGHADAARVASGAQLWLLGGAVAWALLEADLGPFAPWVELVVSGLWPVGPCEGRLVVSEARPAAGNRPDPGRP